MKSKHCHFINNLSSNIIPPPAGNYSLRLKRASVLLCTKSVLSYIDERRPRPKDIRKPFKLHSRLFGKKSCISATARFKTP
jgi:hypothetical protein